jgi:hypothetical protein
VLRKARMHSMTCDSPDTVPKGLRRSQRPCCARLRCVQPSAWRPAEFSRTGKGTEHLAHQDAGWIGREQIRFADADQSQSLAFEIGNDAFLHQEITHHTVQSFNKHGVNAIGEEFRHHVRERGTVVPIGDAADPFSRKVRVIL